MAAELVTRVVSPLMEKLEKVKRQFMYLCCFNSNVESLREEAENLRNERDGLQRRVDTAKRNTDDIILPVVDTWLKRSDEIQVYTNGIEGEIMNVKSGCLAIKSRFLLSRKARKIADAINLHREKGKFEGISLPPPPASMTLIPQGPSDEFDSRKQTENEIMEDLRGGKVHMIGICGMGGVGKTTMAKRIWTRVREEKLFEEVAMVVISQEVRKFEIQREIAEKFGVKQYEEESLSARAHKLHVRLTDAKKKLLILDDIWEKLDLESLGIPCKSDEGEGCTIILTSRVKEVLIDMNAKPFGVQILTPEEAWLLFRGKIGTCTEPKEVLKQVVQECKGLPLALITIGRALKDKSTEHWNHALWKLKSSNPNMPKFLKEVYEPIKLNYDFLGNPDARSLFLLCCLFPEDCDIDLEYLMMYAMGLRIFTDEITTLEEARDRVHVLVDKLKSCFLLLDSSDDQNHVKMHDVVRDVAIFIAFDEGRIVRNLSLTASRREESINCEWISVVDEEINKLPIWSSFPSLRLLKVDSSAGVEVNTDPSFFQGMIKLNVLSSRGFRSLPETTQLLKNLRTLYLEYCDSLETMSVVGELLSLEILICRSCDKIVELPIEIGRLKKLRMLEVNECPELTRIAPGVVSNLVQLEELIIVQSFNGWETKANGEQRNNAALLEIEHLEKLTRLEIDIGDVILTTAEICFPSKVVKFFIGVGREFPYYYDVQCLKDLRTLYLEQCDSLESISIIGILSSLEVLVCRSCDMIVELPAEIGRLESLRILKVYKCRKLESIARGVISNLVQLEELMIVKSFNGWETGAYGEQRGNASICEIEHLEKLRRMEIEIKDSILAAEMMFLEEGKVKYQLRSGGSHWESCEVHDTRGFARWIKNIVDGMVLLKYDSFTCYLWRQQNPPDHSFRRLEAIEIYDSRKQIENAIMKDLRGGKVHMIGICGIGGIGKTTMAGRIMNRVREENLFDEGMMVVFSQEVRELEIQSKLAEMLGVSLEDESLSARANKLRVRLMGAKRILLILDSISDKLDLERLGIPCESDLGEGCTIILTSRNSKVLSKMNAKPFEVQILTDGEALLLFRGKIGTCADDKGLLPIQVVKECKGLPLTLVSTGTALKDKSIEHWRDALRNLRSSNLNVPEEVYTPIKESYDSLDNPVARSLFLLCCLFPEDCDIDLEYLVTYGMGSRLLTDEITTLEKARNSVRLLVDTLKTCSLLQDGSDKDHVKMPNDVRKIANFFASDEGRIVHNLSLIASGREQPINCQWISVVGEETNNLPILFTFPSLRLLKIDDNYPTEVEISNNSSFFKGMIDLNVLSFRSISFRSLPETTQLLKKLRTLYLDGCPSLETISIVGELLSLEILICRSCDMISELPKDIGRLTNLRMLEVYKCRKLERIARGVISNLVQLEELMIVKSFKEWETVAYGDQGGNAAICEIKRLEKLSRMKIEINDSTFAAEMMLLDEGKVKYQLRSGGSHWESCEVDDTHGFARWIKDIVGGMVLLKHDINAYHLWREQNPPDLSFRRLEAIEIYDSSAGKLFYSSTAVNLDVLKELRISKCKNMVKVIENDEEQLFHSKLQALFPSLHNLYLEDLPNLESFSWSRELDLASLENVWIKCCHRLEFFTMQVQLRSLKKVVIRDCNNIGRLFSPYTAANLDNLMTLSIFRCKEMVHVIEKNEAEVRLLFPKLKELEFRDLPKLRSFSNSEYDLELPSLENVDIYGCPLWKEFSMGYVSVSNLKRVVYNSKVNDTGTLEW